MRFTKVTIDWNAEPNAPETIINVEGDTVTLEFYLNYFVHDQFKEGDRGRITFSNCHKYYFGGPNDEGYVMGQHRYSDAELPFGQLYVLKTDWKTDFPVNSKILNVNIEPKELHHFIFFLKERTFECVATDYRFERVSK